MWIRRGYEGRVWRCWRLVAVCGACFAVAAGVLLLLTRLDVDQGPIDLTEQPTETPNTSLTQAELADSCGVSPRPDCDAVLTAICWDGPSGLTQYVCLKTPAESSWERLPRPFEVPARSVSASDSGDSVIVGEYLLDRIGNELPAELVRRDRWLGTENLLQRFEEDGTVTIFEIDGTVVESIPVPSQAPLSFTWDRWALSHDGSQFAVLSGTQTSQLWLYDRDKREWSLLNDDPEYAFFPFITGVGFSPDDQEVIATRVANDDDGSVPPRRFFVVSISVEDGSVKTRRVAESEHGVYSVVSPDGRFMALSNPRGQTRVLNLDSLEVSDRVDLCCGDNRPSWSPGSSFLVTQSGFLMEVVPADVPLTNGPFALSVPDPQEVHRPAVRFQASP